MRGPGFRLNLDVRRVWRCPKCGRERRLLGDVVALRCGCVEEGVCMQIVSEPRRRRPPDPLPVVMTNDEAPNDERMTKLE
jgi:hypothetical protein